jgi:hypothetical protein
VAAKASEGTSKARTTAKTINFFIIPPLNFGKWLPVSPFRFHLTAHYRWFLSHLLSVTGFIHGHIKLGQSFCQQKIAKKCMVPGTGSPGVFGQFSSGYPGQPFLKKNGRQV